MSSEQQWLFGLTKFQTIKIGVLIGVAIGLLAAIVHQTYIEPKETYQKMQNRINEMLLTNQTYDGIMDERNYIDDVGFVWFMYYDGRMHHGSMTFQDLDGRILCCNSERNDQYFKQIMGDPLNEN